jgi:hypothetical protein
MLVLWPWWSWKVIAMFDGKICLGLWNNMKRDVLHVLAIVFGGGQAHLIHQVWIYTWLTYTNDWFLHHNYSNLCLGKSKWLMPGTFVSELCDKWARHEPLRFAMPTMIYKTRLDSNKQWGVAEMLLIWGTNSVQRHMTCVRQVWAQTKWKHSPAKERLFCKFKLDL